MSSSTNCKFRTTRLSSINFSSLVQIQLLLIKSSLLSIEKWFINVVFSTGNNSPTSKNLRSKISPTDSVLIEIQIWQSQIARLNIFSTSECLLVLHWCRITKQNSNRIYCCWDNRKSPRKLRAWQEATCQGNHSLRFERRNVFGLCRWSRVLNGSGKMKRVSNAVSGCRGNWELLCYATAWEGASVSTVNLSYLSKNWPLLSPVSCFRATLTWINAYKGRKYSAAWIALCVFSRVPPLLYCAWAQ